MKIVRVGDTYGTAREVHCPRGGFVSYRPVLESEGMGFSINRTVIPKGDWQHWHYQHHKEACYCIEGRGWIKDLASGETHLIEPGTIYLLDNHDDHMFKAETKQVVLISVFNPPLEGAEVHDENGVYGAPQKVEAKG